MCFPQTPHWLATSNCR